MKYKKYISLKIIGLGILAWLLFHIDISQVVEILLKGHLVFAFGALLFMLVHMFIEISRYQYILTQQEVYNPFLKTIHFSLAANYLSFITPGRFGEVSKGYFIHKAQGIRFDKLLASSLLDRIFDFYTLLLISLLGFAIINPTGASPVPIILIIVLIALIPLIFLIKIFRKKLIILTRNFQKKFTKSDTWHRHLNFFFLKLTSY